MAKPTVFVTRRLPDALLQPLKDAVHLHMWEEELEPVPRETLLEAAAAADGLLTMLSDRIDRALIERAPRLKVVANLAVGFDNIDLAACEERGVIVCNTPDVLTETTADLTFALLMATARRLIEAADYVKNGQWKEWGPYLLAGKDIHHQTIGIFGMGRIGAAVAKRAKGFDMDVIYHNRSRNEKAEKELGARYVGFDELLETADYVVSLLPLTEETCGLFGRAAFKKMKKDAIFINAGRGAVVDEDALYEALVQGEIAAAGLDVFQREPIGKDHPLLKLKQVVALPHIGSASVATRTKMIELCRENLLNVLVRGQSPLTPVPASR